ncbi:mechanosensitive ion channel family protein [Pontibacter qinzhouensis]|uniref:Mechanosensitive ion channel family protein n=1 Tax=Pontibacter qinzhouensis TaxID=2603253 RepID=A0A5C8J4N6_9BACT|nr:mechanosensitive ion channel family protein [Pontibacter qinzhouensis]TXK31144.1 mechanosensitive ion channel family protein [Pontibacter qinzhouensis]
MPNLKRLHARLWPSLLSSPLLVLFALLLLVAPAAHAQLLPETNDTTQTAILPQWPADSLGRRTPRGTVTGFIEAVAAENYNRAARYLSLDEHKKEHEEAAQLAQTLQRVLDKRGNIMPYSWISNQPEGHDDDNLGPNLDRVGTVSVNGDSFDLMLEKTEGPTGEPIWLFSSQTVQRLPVATPDSIAVPLTDQLLPGILKTKKWSGVPVGHWLSMIVLGLMAYLLAWGIISLLLLIIRVSWSKSREEPTAGILKAFALPLQLYLSVWLLVASSQEVGISIIVRQRFSEMNVVVGQVALLLLLWRLVDFISRFSEKRLTKRGNVSGTSAVLFLRRGIKIALFVFGIIAILDTLGFDVTTGLAALGIGGIALALGAQKTVENFVGSVTLIADQPVRVGDFCKVGDTLGTVEQIGMRSTRIRTLARTIVTIPNGEFSSLRIENYAHRDRFWFHPTLSLRFETTPDQIRYLLVELRSILYAHPNVHPDPARIRFVKIAQASFDLEIFAYVHARDVSEFLEIQEDLFLRMMDVVVASGTGFAVPAQTLYMARDKGVSEEKAADVNEKVRQWREAGDMQLPNFDPEQISRLRNTIPFPPEGSSQQTKPQ